MTTTKLKQNPQLKRQLARARESVHEGEWPPEKVDLAHEVAQVIEESEIEVRATMNELLTQLSARELEQWLCHRRQDLEDMEPRTEEWRTVGSMITRGYTLLARYGER